MTGAIEFMKAWRDICNEPKSCEDCTLDIICSGCGFEMSDEDITELVRQVMAEARKPKAEEHKTPKTQEEAYRAYSGQEFWGEDLIGHEREDWG
jgi:predicted small metal-binding protein